MVVEGDFQPVARRTVVVLTVSAKNSSFMVFSKPAKKG